MIKNRIIAIDFDGVMHRGELEKFPSIGAPFPYAKEVISELYKDNYIIIWTCREGGNLIDAINWLLSFDIPFDRVNDNCPENCKKYRNNSRKVYADLYIDDAQLGGFPGWKKVKDILLKESSI